MAEQTKTRRSKWQAIASKKYPRLTFVGGDGNDYECWVVLTKCPHQQTRNWRYALVASQVEAEELRIKWNKERCGYMCQGSSQHTLWKLFS